MLYNTISWNIQRSLLAMWLLNTETRKLESFVDENQVYYAILSHTWGKDEVTFSDIQSNGPIDSKAGYQKIQYTCDQARLHNLKYAWVDTCCIDKSSSAELQESINSMWRWYAKAYRCYAYLEDVSARGLGSGDAEAEGWFRQSLARSRWFERGWTLQELIAPKRIDFFGQDWYPLGDRLGMARMLSQRTRIPVGILESKLAPRQFSIAARMSWAAGRKTTRTEDEAYSLLGLFDINMPMLYGEGKKAFQRLQKEIIRDSTDHSIFAWGKSGGGRVYRSMLPSSAPRELSTQILASEPWEFVDAANVVSAPAKEPYEFTNRGLRMRLPLLKRKNDADPRWEECDAILNCWEGERRYCLELVGWTSQTGDIDSPGLGQTQEYVLYSLKYRVDVQDLSKYDTAEVMILDHPTRS